MNVTVLVPCVLPKFVPAMVTSVEIEPEVGERPPTVGTLPVTEKVISLLTTPLEFATTMGPLVAPAGTGATTFVAVQLEGVDAIPLNCTVPRVVPKCVPLIVIAVPTAPEVGEIEEING